jgi:CRISPR/Cas system CSM-associated protein Csm3 (group 7 of RAMP superfamily)
MVMSQTTEDDMTTLNELNTQRVANGKKPLKVWKASKTALLEAIKKETPMFSQEYMESKTIEEHKADDDALESKKPVNLNKTIAKTAIVKKASPVKGAVSITSIANELKIDPKVARAKLRRHEAKRKGSTWSFSNAADIEAIKKILGADKRKKS